MATYFPDRQSLDPLGLALGQGLGQGIQGAILSRDLQAVQGMGQMQRMYESLYGGTGLQVPQAQMPQMRSPMGQQMQLQGQMGQMFRDPLEREYKQVQIESTKALIAQREAAAKQELPDRMLRQADRYLRVVDDIMSEYWYTPEGPYRDKLLRDAQSARGKAVKLIERFGVDSEAGKVSIQQLGKLDEEIKRAGGKVEPPKPKKVYAKPNKIQFMTTYKNLKTPEEKQRFIDKYWRPEFGRFFK